MTVVNQVWYILMGTIFLALMMEVWFDTVRFPLETNIMCVYSTADSFVMGSVQPATHCEAQSDFELLICLHPLPRS